MKYKKDVYKNMIKNFYKKYTKILWLMGITIFLLLVVFLLMVLFMLSRQEALIEFAKTSAITKEIIPFSILSFIGMGLGGFLIILVGIMTIKMIFPDTKAFTSLMMKDEAGFLLDLPNRIRKEVFKNGK